MYIKKNLDWVMVWIERSQKNCRSLTWEGVASLDKEAHRNEDPNVMPMVIDLENGLRGGKLCIS